MQAQYRDAAQMLVTVTLAAGEVLNGEAGPGVWQLGPEASGAYSASGAQISAYAAPAVVAPDNPTLSDWRVALTLWGRIDDVTGKVAALVASTDPQQAMLGKVAKERLEYANNVLRAQLLTLKDALGFTAADVDESLWRADRVRQGDLSGVWPLPAKAA